MMNVSHPITFSAIEIMDIDLSTSTRGRLVFRKYPYALWIVGTLIFGIACFLMYRLTIGKKVGNGVDGFDQGHWWQFLICFGIYCLGVLFLASGRIKSYVFDR